VQVRQLLADAWSTRGHLTIADALYVVVAAHLDATLATTDLHPSTAPTRRVATIHPQPGRRTSSRRANPVDDGPNPALWGSRVGRSG